MKETTTKSESIPQQNGTISAKNEAPADEALRPMSVTRPSANKPEAKTGELFDLDKLRLKQDFGAEVGVKKLLTHVPVRKPNKQEWVRVNGVPGWSLSTHILTLKAERESYLVAPELWDELPGMLQAVILYVGVSRQKAYMVWPLRLPRADGRLDLWGTSELEAAERAKSAWTRLSANTNAGIYDIYQAPVGLAEPEWPETTFDEIIQLAFKGRYIESPDHPVLRQLRGEL